MEAQTDLTALLDSASDFASYPGLQTDASVKEFLDRFPLPLIFSVLQTGIDTPGHEATLVACLDRIFKTKYGASLLLQYASFLQAGLCANSNAVRSLACKTVPYILQNTEDGEKVMKMISELNIYPLLIECLLDGDERTSAASIDAIKTIAQYPEGIGLIFPASTQDPLHLKNVATRGSSLGKIRVLALIKELFSLTSSIALYVYKANLLKLYEEEINKTDDILSTLTALELLYELVESPHSSQYLLKTTLLQILTNTIRDSSLDAVLRCRAILISGRLLSSADAYKDFDESRVTSVLLAIDERLKLLEDQDSDECESAFEALGQIGMTSEGAVFLLQSSSPLVRYILESAFGRQGRGKRLAALHALGDICGANRAEDKIMLADSAEKCLRQLFYAAAANSSKLTPSGLLLSVLQQEPEIRLAAYRLIAAIAVRPWGLMEVCSKHEIISVVTDANIEATKIGMEARFNCCATINKALSSSNMVDDANIAQIAAKLQDAVKRGPYLTKKHMEAQPTVTTADRF